MDGQTIIGLAAAGCTTASFIPQVWKVVRTKETKGISLTMYIIFTGGVICWLIYGFLLGDIPMITANIISLVLSLILLVYKLRHG